MPINLTDDVLETMIQRGYLILSEHQDCPNKLTDEMLFEFGQVPPESDVIYREIYFTMYQEAMDSVPMTAQNRRLRPRKRYKPRRKR